MLLKVVSHYDLSVLSMLAMGFHAQIGVGGVGVSSIQFLFWEFFNFAKPPLIYLFRLPVTVSCDGESCGW